MTKDDVDAVMDVFTPDGTYSAFCDTYSLADFPTLVAAAPKGLFMVGTPALELDGAAGTGTGEQPLCFVDQTDHAMRIGWYTDTYRLTESVWRLAPRRITLLHTSGARHPVRGHAPSRPLPATLRAGSRWRPPPSHNRLNRVTKRTRPRRSPPHTRTTAH